MIKIIDWNIAHRQECWQTLVNCDADIALLQEANEPSADIASQIEVDSAPWVTAGAGTIRPWRTAVVGLSDRVKLEWLKPLSIKDASPRDFAVSRLGTLSAAIVTPPQGHPFIVASMYAPWGKTSCFC